MLKKKCKNEFKKMIKKIYLNQWKKKCNLNLKIITKIRNMGVKVI